jgi:hypothetical protein
MQNTEQNTLPDKASALIALARVAHRNGDRALERAAREKLVQRYGIDLRFRCEESVDEELGA